MSLPILCSYVMSYDTVDFFMGEWGLVGFDG